MKRSEVFPSRYWKAEDLGEDDGDYYDAKIKLAPFESLKGNGGGVEHKVVLHFAGETKTLPLNRTNYDAVTKIAGTDETEDWPGVWIRMFRTTTEMGGEIVPCIRLKPVPQQKKQAQQPKKQSVMPEEPPPEDPPDERDYEFGDDDVPQTPPKPKKKPGQGGENIPY
jgi:hypothetical protein